MKAMNQCALLFALIMIPLLIPIGLFISGQPQGYTLVLSPTQYFSAAPWMNVKAIYMKTDSSNLYWYTEYAGAIPNSGGSYRVVYVYMDTDNSTLTGYQTNGRGMDYRIYCYLYGDNSSSYARLYNWSVTSDWWQAMPANLVGLTRQPGLSYLEVWVSQQVVGYSSRGLCFYLDTYAYTGGVPETTGSYVLGSHVRTINIDGNAADWGDTPAAIAFPAASTIPSELECSALYMANDQDNLYLRFDMRGTPTSSIGAGTLNRHFYLYPDTDDNNATGYLYSGGSEYEIYLSFTTRTNRGSYLDVYRYEGTGEDWTFNWIDTEDEATADGNILEASIPLANLGLGTSGRINLYVEHEIWYLSDTFPRPSQFVKFPVAAAGAGDLGIVKLFGSETVFLAVVVGLMLVEGVLVYIIARRGSKPVSVPPPP